MRAYHILSSLAGSAVIYVAMAACSSSGSGGAGGGRDGGDFSDVLTDPVAEASADPVSGSRLKAYYHVGEDGSKAYDNGHWWDSTRGEDCYFQPASDGKLHCLPTTPTTTAVVFYYIDDKCTQAVIEATNGCGFKYVVDYSLPAPGCGTQGGAKILSVNGPVMLDISTKFFAYSKQSNVCAPTLLNVNPSSTYLAVGQEIPPTAFVSGSIAHD